jgi:putative peptidoglycan lipid II flippase
MVLAEPIIELLLQYGKFSARDTAATAAALMFYAPGLVGYSAVKIASPSFYSLGDSRTPATVSIVSIVMNLVLNVMLVRVMGYRGLALGTAIAALFNASMLLFLLSRRLDGLDGRQVAVSFAKILCASILMGAAAHFFAVWITGVLPGLQWYWRAVRVAGAISAGVLVLMATAHLLAIEEFNEAMNRVIRRFVTPRSARR